MNKPFVPERLEPPLAEFGVSISDLKRNPAAVIAEAQKHQVAILNRNKPVAYVISAKVWERVIDLLEDEEDVRIVRERLKNPAPRIRVEIDDLV
jgi:antitoxin StbD